MTFSYNGNSFRYVNKRDILQYLYRMEYGHLTNDDNYMNLIRGDINLNYHFLLKKSRLSLYAGFNQSLSFDYISKTNNTNNPYAYIMLLSSDFSVIAKYRFSLGNVIFELQNQLWTPVLTVASSSSYSTVTPPELYEEEGEPAKAFKICTFNKYTRINNKLDIDIKIPYNISSIFPAKNKKYERSTWRLTYMYSGFSYKNDFKLSYSTHIFMIGRVIRIFNY